MCPCTGLGTERASRDTSEAACQRHGLCPPRPHPWLVHLCFLGYEFAAHETLSITESITPGAGDNRQKSSCWNDLYVQT